MLDDIVKVKKIKKLTNYPKNKELFIYPFIATYIKSNILLVINKIFILLYRDEIFILLYRDVISFYS